MADGNRLRFEGFSWLALWRIFWNPEVNARGINLNVRRQQQQQQPPNHFSNGRKEEGDKCTSAR